MAAMAGPMYCPLVKMEAQEDVNMSFAGANQQQRPGLDIAAIAAAAVAAVKQQEADCESPSKKRKRLPGFAPGAPAAAAAFNPAEPEPLAQQHLDGAEDDMMAIDEKDLTPQQRKERRKIRNRISAQLHRQRQRSHVDTLEQQLAVKNAEIAALQGQVAALADANDALMRRVKQLESEATAAAAMNDAADLAVMSGLEELNFLSDDGAAGAALTHTSAPVLLSSDECATDGEHSAGTTSATDYSSSADSSGIDSEPEDNCALGGSGGGTAAGASAAAAAVPPPAQLQRQCSFDMALHEGRPHDLDEVELDLGMFDVENVPTVLDMGFSSSPTAAAAAAAPPSGGSGAFASRRSGVAGMAAFGMMFLFTVFSKSRAPAPIGSELVPNQWSAAAGGGAAAPRGRVLRAITDAADDLGRDGDAPDLSSSVNATAVMFPAAAVVRPGRYADGAASAATAAAPPRPGWAFSPNERVPAAWRGAPATRAGLAPWTYARALDLLGGDALPWMGPPAVTRDGKEKRGGGAAHRAAAAAADSFGVDFYRGGSSGGEVDVYRGGGSGRAGGGAGGSGDAQRCGVTALDMAAASPADKSYLFCPSAHGMMSPRMVANAARTILAPSPAASAGGAGAAAAAVAEAAQQERSLVLQRPVSAYHVGGGGSSSSAGGASGGGGTSVDRPFPEQFMTLLVPSSSVDWGRLSGGLGMFNATAEGHGEGWLEIGCHVVSARVVQGVSFVV